MFRWIGSNSKSVGEFQVMDDTDLVGVNAAWEDFLAAGWTVYPFRQKAVENTSLKKRATKVRMKIKGFVLIICVD